MPDEVVVILAGGLGTRMSEETQVKPKPMVDILGIPLIVRIMNQYAQFGFTNFVICAGYRGEVIKQYFANFQTSFTDLDVDLGTGRVLPLQPSKFDWRVKVIDTGADTMTGGRLKRVESHVSQTFFMTYGDGVGDIDILRLLAHHRENGKLATLTAVPEPSRFAILDIDHTSSVVSFQEKPIEEKRKISAGFFVLEKPVLELIDGDDAVFERGPLEELSSRNQLSAFIHRGYWQAVDSLRDKTTLENAIASGLYSGGLGH